MMVYGCSMRAAEYLWSSPNKEIMKHVSSLAWFAAGVQYVALLLTGSGISHDLPESNEMHIYVLI